MSDEAKVKRKCIFCNECIDNEEKAPHLLDSARRRKYFMHTECMDGHAHETLGSIIERVRPEDGVPYTTIGDGMSRVDRETKYVMLPGYQ